MKSYISSNCLRRATTSDIGGRLSFRGARLGREYAFFLHFTQRPHGSFLSHGTFWRLHWMQLRLYELLRPEDRGGLVHDWLNSSILWHVCTGRFNMVDG